MSNDLISPSTKNTFAPVVDFIRAIFKEQDSPIYLHEPRFIGNEKAYLNDCIDSTFVSSVGAYVNKIEEVFKTYTGAKYAVAVSNGTSALHMGLILTGVKRNDLVITQPLTFIATCNAISYIGAQPVFVDIDKDTLGLSPEKLKEFLEKETFEKADGQRYHKQSGQRISACVPMHCFGFPVKIDRIAEICKTFNVPLVEDAAESLGSTYKDQHTGTFGDIGIYSFNGNKIVTSGGGGMIVTNDEAIGKMAKHLTTQAKMPHRWEFNHDHIGYNYRLPNLNAALACAQMEQLDNYIGNKRELHKAYQSFFESTAFEFITETTGSRANCWLNAILLEDRSERDAFLTYTNDNHVMTRPVWNLMTTLEMFKDSLCENIDNAKYIADRLVNIPSSVRLK